MIELVKEPKLDKDDLESYLEENVLIAYDIQVLKKQTTGVIENKITICKTGEIFNE